MCVSTPRSYELHAMPSLSSSPLRSQLCSLTHPLSAASAGITDMCMAFINANEEEKKAKERTQKSAFGGGREEYDPKNPHKRSGAKQQQQQQQQQQRVGQ